MPTHAWRGKRSPGQVGDIFVYVNVTLSILAAKRTAPRRERTDDPTSKRAGHFQTSVLDLETGDLGVIQNF